jgi:hypothetical protein
MPYYEGKRSGPSISPIINVPPENWRRDWKI